MTARAIILPLALLVFPIGFSRAQEAPGCGPTNIKFDVKTMGGQHALPSPDPGKALVIFLQDDLKFNSRPRPTTRFGIDGTWVGATQANSYFFVSVDPGEHHLCASWQSRVSVGIPTRPTAATHFTAESGKTYYFRARDIGRPASTDRNALQPLAEVMLEPVDSDEGQVLLSSFAYSSSHPKK